ncbi:hypothetical protein [Sorangium sp. So ce233]|uniref:hypothetical protein n=1 Tax=Sorangium sp. So ce233 TaxID=3133290 RepID=UPI003F5E5E3E
MRDLEAVAAGEILDPVALAPGPIAVEPLRRVSPGNEPAEALNRYRWWYAIHTVDHEGCAALL